MVMEMEMRAEAVDHPPAPDEVRVLDVDREVIVVRGVSLKCQWNGHAHCGGSTAWGEECGCHCHDMVVLGHHPGCDGECVECPVLVEREGGRGDE